MQEVLLGGEQSWDSTWECSFLTSFCRVDNGAPQGAHTAYTPRVMPQQSSQGHITRMRSTGLKAQSVSFGRKDLSLLKGLHLEKVEGLLQAPPSQNVGP